MDAFTEFYLETLKRLQQECEGCGAMTTQGTMSNPNTNGANVLDPTNPGFAPGDQRRPSRLKRLRKRLKKRI